MKKFSVLWVAMTLVTLVFVSAAFADTYVYTDSDAKAGLLVISGDTLTVNESSAAGIYDVNLGNQIKVFGESKDHSTAYLGGKGEIVKVKASGDLVVSVAGTSFKPAIAEVKSFAKSGDFVVATGVDGLFVSSDADTAINFTSADATLKAAAPLANEAGAVSDAFTDLYTASAAGDVPVYQWFSVAGDELPKAILTKFLGTLNGTTIDSDGANATLATAAMLAKARSAATASGSALALNSKGQISYVTKAGATSATTTTFNGPVTGMVTLAGKPYLASSTGVKSGFGTEAIAAGLEKAAEIQEAIATLSGLLSPIRTRLIKALTVVGNEHAEDVADAILKNAAAKAFTNGAADSMTIKNLFNVVAYAAIIEQTDETEAYGALAAATTLTDAAAVLVPGTTAVNDYFRFFLVAPKGLVATDAITELSQLTDAAAAAAAANLTDAKVLAAVKVGVDAVTTTAKKAVIDNVVKAANALLTLTGDTGVLNYARQYTDANAYTAGAQGLDAAIAGFKGFAALTNATTTNAVLTEALGMTKDPFKNAAALKLDAVDNTSTVSVLKLSPYDLMRADATVMGNAATAFKTGATNAIDTAQLAAALGSLADQVDSIAKAKDDEDVAAAADALEDLADAIKEEAFMSGNVEALAADEANKKIYAYAGGKVYVQATDATTSTDITGEAELSFTTTIKSLDMVASDSYLSFIDDNGLSVYKIGTDSLTKVGETYEGIVSVARLDATLGGTDPTPPTPPTPVASPVLDINSLDPEVANAIVSALGATSSADFLTSADVSVDTTAEVTDAVKAAINKESAMGGKDAKSITPVITLTLKEKDGFILREAAYDAAKYVVFFIDESLLAAEEDGMNQATLLNDKGEAITEGTSTYVGAGSLEAGHTYTMYVAEKDTGTEPTNEGGSSGGGCEVGLGLWSLAALVALTKLSGRRYVK